MLISWFIYSFYDLFVHVYISLFRLNFLFVNRSTVSLTSNASENPVTSYLSYVPRFGRWQFFFVVRVNQNYFSLFPWRGPGCSTLVNIDRDDYTVKTRKYIIIAIKTWASNLNRSLALVFLSSFAMTFCPQSNDVFRRLICNTSMCDRRTSGAWWKKSVRKKVLKIR